MPFLASSSHTDISSNRAPYLCKVGCFIITIRVLGSFDNDEISMGSNAFFKSNIFLSYPVVFQINILVKMNYFNCLTGNGAHFRAFLSRLRERLGEGWILMARSFSPKYLSEKLYFWYYA